MGEPEERERAEKKRQVTAIILLAIVALFVVLLELFPMSERERMDRELRGRGRELRGDPLTDGLKGHAP